LTPEPVSTTRSTAKPSRPNKHDAGDHGTYNAVMRQIDSGRSGGGGGGGYFVVGENPAVGSANAKMQRLGAPRCSRDGPRPGAAAAPHRTSGVPLRCPASAQGVLDSVAELGQLQSLVVVEVLGGRGGAQPSELVDHDGVLAGRHAPGELAEQHADPWSGPPGR